MGGGEDVAVLMSFRRSRKDKIPTILQDLDPLFFSLSFYLSPSLSPPLSFFLCPSLRSREGQAFDRFSRRDKRVSFRRRTHKSPTRAGRRDAGRRARATPPAKYRGPRGTRVPDAPRARARHELFKAVVYLMHPLPFVHVRPYVR